MEMSSKSYREHTNVVIVASQVQLLGSLNVKGHNNPRLTGKGRDEATSGWTQDPREGHTGEGEGRDTRGFLRNASGAPGSQEALVSSLTHHVAALPVLRLFSSPPL